MAFFRKSSIPHRPRSLCDNGRKRSWVSLASPFRKIQEPPLPGKVRLRTWIIRRSGSMHQVHACTYPRTFRVLPLRSDSQTSVISRIVRRRVALQLLKSEVAECPRPCGITPGDLRVTTLFPAFPFLFSSLFTSVLFGFLLFFYFFPFAFAFFLLDAASSFSCHQTSARRDVTCFFADCIFRSTNLGFKKMNTKNF